MRTPLVTIDRDELAARHKTLKLLWYAYGTTPLVIVLIAWVIAKSTHGGDGPGSGSVDSMLLYVLLGAATMPLVGVGVVRTVRRRLVTGMVSNPASSVSLGAALTQWAMVEAALWEAITLTMFVAFMVGMPMAYLIGAGLITTAGNVSSYPRLSEWFDVADEVDQIARYGSVGRESLPS